MFDPDTLETDNPEPRPKLWLGFVVSFDRAWTFFRHLLGLHPVVLCLLLGASPALAATTVDVPGNGIDEDSTGGDQACASPDADCDGYTSDGTLGTYGTTNTDCNDSDGQQYPGTQIASGCSGSDYKTCQTSGSYTSCSTGPLCEATGSGSCYYINPASGNDNNPGTYASPFATLNNISYYSSGAPGTHITPVKGSVFYLVGSTNLTGTHTGCYGGTFRCGFSTQGLNGDATDHFKLKRYPGATLAIAPGNTSGTDGGAIEVYNSDYWDFEDLEITGGYGSGIFGGYGVDHVTYSRVYVHDKDGDANNNLAGIQFDGAAGVNAHHNRIKDVCDSTATSTVKWYNTRGIGVFQSSDFDVGHNQIWYTLGVSDSGNCKGRGIGQKHALTTAEAGTSRIHHNRIWNAYDQITICSANTEVDHNLLVSDNEDNYCYREISGNGGTNTYHYLKNLDVHHNTMIGCLFNQDYEASARSSTYVGGNDYDHNVITSARGSYSGSSDLISLCVGCSGAEYTAISGANTYHDNNYYASAATAKFYANGELTFAQWNSAGYDGTGTVVTNPTLNAYLQTTAVNTTDKGWSLVNTSTTTTVGTTTTTVPAASNMGGLAPRYQ